MRSEGAFGPLLAAACSWALLLSAGARAAEITLTPGFAATGEYTDNLDFDAENRRTDLFVTLTPSLQYRADAESLDFSASAAADVLRYREATEENDVRPTVAAALRGSPSERLDWSVGARFRKSSSLETQLTETGLVTKQTDQRTVSGNAGLTYRLQARAELAPAYTYTKNWYSSGSETDYRAHTASLSYAVRSDGWLSSWKVSPRYTRSRSDDFASHAWAAIVGASFRPGETTEVTASLGPRYTFTDDLSDSDEGQRTDWGLDADLGFTWSGETASAGANLVQTQAYSSGGQPTNTARVSLWLSKALAERWRASLSASYGNSWYPGQSRHTTRYIEATASLSWQVSEHGSLAASYNYANSYDRDRDGGDTAERNRVWLTANFTFPERW